LGLDFLLSKVASAWAWFACVVGAACLDPEGDPGPLRIPAGLISPASDGCPSTPVPFVSCLEPGRYVFGVDPPSYRTPVPALPLGSRSQWDYVEAGTYGVSLPLDDGSSLVWYLGVDTSLTERIGVATTFDYSTWTKVAVSSGAGQANVVIGPTSACERGGFIGGFGIVQRAGGTFAALLSAYTATAPNWCLHTSADGVHWSLSPASPVYRSGKLGAVDDFATEVRALLQKPGGYIALAQVVDARSRLRRVALHFSPDLVHWSPPSIVGALAADTQDHGATFVWAPGHADPVLLWERMDSRTTATSLYLARLIMIDSSVTADRFPQPLLQPGPAGGWDSGQIFAWTQHLIVVGGQWRMVYGGGAGTYKTAAETRGAGYVEWTEGHLGFVSSPDTTTTTIVTKPFRWGMPSGVPPSGLVVQASPGVNADLTVRCGNEATMFGAPVTAVDGQVVLSLDATTLQRLDTCPVPPFAGLTLTLSAGARLYSWRQVAAPPPTSR
jgi:hypothetical protein